MHRFTYRIALAALIVTPPVFLALSAKQERHQHEECLQTLQRIDSIKEQRMMDGRTPAGYQPRWSDLRAYLGNPEKDWLPTCPEGGCYTLGRVGETPRCSVHGPLDTERMACHALVREIDAAKEQIGMDGWMTLGYQTRHGTMDDSPICEGTIAPWRRNAQTGKHQRVHPR